MLWLRYNALQVSVSVLSLLPPVLREVKKSIYGTQALGFASTAGFRKALERRFGAPRGGGARRRALGLGAVFHALSRAKMSLHQLACYWCVVQRTCEPRVRRRSR